MGKNLFIVFEGIDGCGKSTLSKNLEQILNEKGLVVSRFFEPTDFATGKFIRQFLRGDIQLSKKEQIEAFIADRKNSVSKNILPALEKGHVILDRYYYSTAAYQAGEEFSPEEILTLNQKENFPKPDLLFFLKILPELALQRVHSRFATKERFDSLEILETIYNNFLKVLPQETIYLDASVSEKELLQLALTEISSKIFRGLEMNSFLLLT